MKALIDRGYRLACNYHKPDHTSLLEGQRQALRVTGANDYEVVFGFGIRYWCAKAWHLFYMSWQTKK
jgi:hypothetical protein